MALSPAAITVLTRAAERPDRRLEFHRKLPTGGRHRMIDALLRAGLIAETQGDYRLGDGALLIEDAATGLMLTTLALTDAGFRAIDREPPTAATGADTALHVASAEVVADDAAAVADALDAAPVALTARANLHSAAAAVLAAWDDEDNRATDIIAALEAPMNALRTLLAEPAPRTTGKPREGTKQAAVLALLARTEGTTVAQIIEATGWQQHTVRGFLAGLKRKGTTIEPIERVRQVGPEKQGAKGSYTVYRLATAA